MRKGIKALLLLVVGVIICSCAPVQNTGSAEGSGHLMRIVSSGELVLGTTGQMPPLNMLAKNGEVIGFEIDFAKAMAKSLGVDLRVKTMPFYQLLPALELGSVDLVMSGMTMTPSRNLRFAFIGPYLSSGKAILAKSQTLARVTETSRINTSATKIAVLKGSTSQAFVEKTLPNVQLSKTDDYEEAINLILKDQVHALIADYPICLVALLRYPEAGFVSIESLLTYEPYGIALPTNDPHLLNWMENFMLTIEGSGDLEALESKWFETADWTDRVW